MSLGLVAYGSSGESDTSDTEDPTPGPQPGVKPTPSAPKADNSNSSSDKRPNSYSQRLDPHISDEEDDFLSESPGGLSLPPPRSTGMVLPQPKGGGPGETPLGIQQTTRVESNLLAGLPAPKAPGGDDSFQGEDELEDIVKPKPVELELAKQEKPPAKKRQTVKISVPSLEDLDEEEEEPSKKKTKFVATGKSGLFALLPEPKNTSIKAAGRSLIPHTLSQRQRQAAKPAVPKPAPPSVSKPSPRIPTTPATLLKLPGVPLEEYSDDEDDAPLGNFFSIGSDSNVVSSAPIVSAPQVTPMPGVEVENRSSTASDSSHQEASASDAGAQDAPLEFDNPMDAPLQFKNSSVPAYHMHNEGFAAGYQEQAKYNYNQPYEEEAEEEAQGMSVMSLPEEELLRLQGKNKRGREAINFVDVNVDDKLAGSSIELTKGITEEQQLVSHSRSKKDQPSSQQKRKHQITYLAHKAKEREFELKNSWAENRLTKKQTQAKYGF